MVMLTLTTAHEGKMWEKCLETISEEDKKWMIDAWIGDTNGILAFVSLNLPVRRFSS